MPTVGLHAARSCTTAREALLAEAIGDVSQLLAQAESLRVAMDDARVALDRGREQLAAGLDGVEARILGITEFARAQVARDISHRVDDAARRTLEARTAALSKAMAESLPRQFESALQPSAAALRRIASRFEHPWTTWLQHAATAVGASMLTWIATTYPSWLSR